jgi:hypothetical protein
MKIQVSTAVISALRMGTLHSALDHVQLVDAAVDRTKV